MRRRVSRYRIASADGPIDRIKIGCVFGIIKGAYWFTAAAQGRKADLAFASIVSDKHQFAFCGVPKVATKSIRAALLRTPEIAAFAVDRNAAALAAEDSPYRFYHRFSFVRNPWSRVVSCYCQKIMIQPETVVGQLSIIAKHPGLFPGLPFDDFVDWLCSEEGSDQCADRHWMSQHIVLADGDGSIVCDFVGRLENLRWTSRQSVRSFACRRSSYRMATGQGTTRDCTAIASFTMSERGSLSDGATSAMWILSSIRSEYDDFGRSA
jgi:hypothetical protein